MPPPISYAVALRRADATLRSFPHAEYVPTLTVAAALRVKAALSKAKAAWWPWPLTVKVVSESRVTWATFVPILFFLGLSVLDLGQTYVNT